MNVSKEIAALQAAYAARPFAVYWTDSRMSGEFRFETFDEAFEYVQYQWARIQASVAENSFMASKLYQSYLETPAGKMPLRWFLLTNDVSSY